MCVAFQVFFCNTCGLINTQLLDTFFTVYERNVTEKT